jgi:hypothetical protein
MRAGKLRCWQSAVRSEFAVPFQRMDGLISSSNPTAASELHSQVMFKGSFSPSASRGQTGLRPPQRKQVVIGCFNIPEITPKVEEGLAVSHSK